MEIKEILKKTWHFIWHDDSILSWIVNIILAFILVKFIIYPGLGLMFATDYPIVAVVSSSMEHNEKFDSWWTSQEVLYKDFNITKEDFSDYKFKNGFNKGDIMVIFGTEKIKKGDVIVFVGSTTDPIIHRVVEVSDGSYRTKGDNNSNSRPDEMAITNNKVLGKAVFRMPYFGWVKIMFVDLVKLVRG